jgi:predicted nucleotidyltransferase
MPEDLDLEPRHLAIVCQALAQHVPGLAVWAFGSRTKGKAKPHSDLDLAVITTEPMPLQQAAQLAEALSESDLPWRVDVVDWASTSEPFRQLIQAHHVVLQHPSDQPG